MRWSLAGISITTPVQPQAFTVLIFFGDTAAEGEDLGFQSQGGDVLDRGAILVGYGGHSRLNSLHAQRIELAGDRDFFFAAEDHRGLLLAVAQGHVMNFDLRGEIEILAHLRQIIPGADKPFVRFPGLLHMASVRISR